MATDKQLAANRANSRKSTGPRSAEGEARVSKNAVRHGLSSPSAYAVLRIEEPDEVGGLLQASIDHYQPADEEEMQAVERIALAKLSILRCSRLEAGMFTHVLGMSLNDDNVTPFVSLEGRLTAGIEVSREQVRNYALADGLHRLAQRPNMWQLFLRYQSQSERHYRRAVESFHDLRRHRISPNKPNSAARESPPPKPDSDAPGSEPSPQTPPRVPAPGPRPLASTLQNLHTAPSPTPLTATLPALAPRVHFTPSRKQFQLSVLKPLIPCLRVPARSGAVGGNASTRYGTFRRFCRSSGAPAPESSPAAPSAVSQPPSFHSPC